MTAVESALIVFIGFSSIAAMTWLFSYRPRLFVRFFVPPTEYRDAVQRILRAPDFGRGMRMMALLQLSTATVSGIVVLLLR